MQAISTTLIRVVIDIAILNCFLNKIFNDFQIRKNITNFKILLKVRELMKFYLEIRESYGAL